MRIGFLKVAVCLGAFAAASIASTYDASALTQAEMKAKSARLSAKRAAEAPRKARELAAKRAREAPLKEAAKDAAMKQHDLMGYCRRLSYRRTPGGATTLDSEARLREIDSCYRRGGNLL